MKRLNLENITALIFVVIYFLIARNLLMIAQNKRAHLEASRLEAVRQATSLTGFWKVDEIQEINHLYRIGHGPSVWVAREYNIKLTGVGPHNARMVEIRPAEVKFPFEQGQTICLAVDQNTTKRFFSNNPDPGDYLKITWHN